MFRPRPGQILQIGNESYRFLPHPASPSFPYGQEGRMAVVYKVRREIGDVTLSKDANYKAFKIFKALYQEPQIEVKAQELRNFGMLPGLQVCIRQVISPSKQEYKPLLEKFPDLAYATLMPWVPGETWGDVMLRRQPLTAKRAWDLAQSLLTVLQKLEYHNIAHCDLSATNVMVDWQQQPVVALVDVEQLYAPGLSKPENLLVGSPGYMPKFDHDRLWGPLGDRFAGAILLSEMLSWYHPDVVRYGNEQSYFLSDEIHTDSERYHLIRRALRHWSPTLERLFQQVWHASSLENCPPFHIWQQAFQGQQVDLKEYYPVYKPGESILEDPSSSEVDEDVQITSISSLISSSSNAKDLLHNARQKAKHGLTTQALEIYQHLIDLVAKGASIDPDINLEELLTEYNSLIFHQFEILDKELYQDYSLRNTQIQSLTQAQRLGYWLGGLSRQQLFFILGSVMLLAVLIVGYIVPLARYSSWADISLGTIFLAFLLALFSHPPIITALFSASILAGWIGINILNRSTNTVMAEEPNLVSPLLAAVIGSWIAAWGIERFNLDIRKKRWAHMFWSVSMAFLVGMLIDELAYDTLGKFNASMAWIFNPLLGLISWYLGYYMREVILAFRESSLTRGK